MNLRAELQQLVTFAIIDSDVDVAYKSIIRYMKVRARKGDRSCGLRHHTRWLSIDQVEAVKRRLRYERIAVVEHYDPKPYTELRW